jgi:hypothetical protein
MPVGRLAVAALVAALLLVPAARAATPEASTDQRLQDRREVAAGDRAYVEGFQDGRFYANGWHISGEMGGVWSPPLKLLDGIWFGLDDQWVGQATRFSSGWGYTRFDLPDADGLQLERTDFAPDGRRAALFGLKMTNPAADDRTVTVKVDAHSELMTAYPWGFAGVTPNAAGNLADHGAFADKALRFTDDGTPSGAPEHHYTALVAANQDPASGTAAESGGAFRGPQDDRVCHDGDNSPPSDCDDGPFGRGTGGELQYSVTVPAGASKTLWVAAAGSDEGLVQARHELDAALQDPESELADKVAARERLSQWSQVSLPGDPVLQRAVDWGKQNLADLTQTASDLRIRWTNQGKQFPSPLGTVAHARWFGAGFPDYPWIFATDGEYTAFAALALGQFEAAEDHLRALRDISDVLNARSGIVVHETVSDGSVWFGHDSQTTNPDGSKTNDFNTDETIKFPSIVATVWRWTGDDGFRDEMYDFAKRNLQAVDRRLDVDRDGWPEGSGNVERPGMGPEKLDNAAYYIRALFDLADMARSKGDGRAFGWATGLAHRLLGQFERTWWDAAARQYADSLLDPGNRQSFQKHWIGQVPMEAELTFDGDQATPGLASFDHGNAALSERENSCYSGERPGSLWPVPHGLWGRRGRQGRLRDLLADHRHPSRRRGELRSPRPRPTAALHRRQRGDDVLRAGDGRDPGRAAGGDAGDLPVGPARRPGAGHPAEHRAVLDLPLDVHAGVGQLRNGVAGDPPAARRAAVPEPRRAAGRARGAVRPAERGGHEHPRRERVAGRARHALGQHRLDHGRRDARTRDYADRRPRAPTRIAPEGRPARRSAAPALRRPPHQPRPRSHGIRPAGRAAHAQRHNRIASAPGQRPG